MNSNRDRLIDDLNEILADYFDYVPLFKTMNVVDELIRKGWKFEKEFITERKTP